MTKLNMYLYFNGNCAEALEFYKDALGGTIETKQLFGEMPGFNGPEEKKDQVMHAVLATPDFRIMMSDGQTGVEFGDNFSLSLNFDNQEAQNKVFEKLKQEGKITLPLEKTFWNAIFGMVTDKFGVSWQLNFDLPKE